LLSVVFAESGDNLAHLLRFYAPHAERLLDVTYGGGTLSRRVSVPVVGVDKDPASKASIIADSASALPFDDGTFRAAVYDPPYLYGSKAMHMGPIGTKTWEVQRSTWNTPEDLRSTSEGIARQLYRVLAEDGVVFVKIMDSRFKGRLIRNHDIVVDAFEAHGWRLHDVVVYVRTVTGSFVNAVSAQSTHGYFLIFKKPVKRRKAQRFLKLEAAS